MKRPPDAIPLTELKGVGASLSSKLAKIGLRTVQDLLLHLPLRYEDRSRVYAIADLLPGLHAAVQGEVRQSQILFAPRRMLVCQLADSSGVITLCFFTFNAAMKNAFTVGQQIWAYGEARRGRYGVEMIHPEYKVLTTPAVNRAPGKETLQNRHPPCATPASTTLVSTTPACPLPAAQQTTLTPVYPTTEGLHQATLRKLANQALALLDEGELAELLPAALTGAQISLPQALHILHHPPSSIAPDQLEQARHPAQRRLILEELLAHHLSMLAMRARAQRYHAWPLPVATTLKQRLLTSLPFTATAAQQRVIGEIETDLQQSTPMMRLIQGDVGSGKTLVAALAALSAIAAGKQVALMAPTELLAAQHQQTLENWLSPLGVNIGYLTGKQSAKQRETPLAAIASGEVAVVIGTHAVFQQQVQFHQLALVIIDEQHRFGVHQRLALWEKGQQHQQVPHQLIMTATPIPRTLAMTAYADLDISVIDELPAGRRPVTTVVIADTRRDEVIARVRHACLQENRQAYWVCTLIDESELLEAQAAEVTCQALKQQLADLRIGLLHGRMKAAEKQTVMQAFSAGELHLLVATTVIEVGVDVPKASLMIIDNAERLGLAQLHQLRGRVGRGSVESHCVLLYKTPLSKTARARLQVLRDSHDGFAIAQKDLEIRGPGELLGSRQTGNVAFKVADLLRDQSMIPQVRRIALQMHQHYPQQAAALIARWMPKTERYSHA